MVVPLWVFMPCRVLLEAPALPMPAVRQFLQQVAEGGPEWCTLALLAARDIILLRPPSREPLMQLVLDSCAAPTSDTRSKSVRLVANRLFSDAGMAPQIEQAARQRLDAMLLPTAPPATDATAPKREARAGSPSDLAPSPGGEAPAAGQDAAAGSSSGLKQQRAIEEEEAEEAPAAARPTDVEAAQLCALYCALCTKKHSLLRHLFEVYGQTSGRWPLAACGCTHMPFDCNVSLMNESIYPPYPAIIQAYPSSALLGWPNIAAAVPCPGLLVQMAAAWRSSETRADWLRPSAPAPQPC